MEMKTCKVCQLEKPITDYKEKKKGDKYYLMGKCKSCYQDYYLCKNKNNYEKNKLSIIASVKSYRDTNNDILNEKKRLDRINYPEKYKVIEASRNKEQRKINQKKSNIKHKERRNKQQNTRNKVRRLNDPLYKIKCNIRTLIGNSIKRNNFKKTSRTVDILGCSIQAFKEYLESHFECWMNWDNYGLYNGELNYGWDIDHVIPVSSGLTESDIVNLNHYTNLRPLCSKVNRDIKGSKQINLYASQ